MTLPVSIIEWESAFFGRKVARLPLEGTLPELNALDDYCRAEHIELVQACVDSSDKATISALEHLGFEFVDRRLYMAGDVSRSARYMKDSHICRSQESDIPRLLPVSHHSFNHISRYNWKDFFTVAQVDAFYDTWLENSVRGKHDHFCLQYETEGRVAGLVTIRLQSNSAYIGIISVHHAFRGRGIGSTLVESTFAYAKEHGLATVSSATQGKNAVTQNLYHKHGMHIRETQSWYYKKI